VIFRRPDGIGIQPRSGIRHTTGHHDKQKQHGKAEDLSHVNNTS
jgi:hypothetical protein